MAVLLSLDYGTEGVRVGAYDVSGTPLASAAASYPTTYPRPGWAEQDPDTWWSATCAAAREVLAEPAVRGAGPVVGLGLATTASTVVVCDAAGRPLRPALLWMDARATAEARRTAELRDQHPVLAFSGGSDAVEWLVPKAAWLSAHQPEIWSKADRVVECVDYLAWRLTGRWTGSLMNAVCKANYDPERGRYADELFGALGVPDLADKLPDEVLPVGTCIGPLTDTAAADLGITGRPAVAVGGIDAHVSLVACGSPDPGTVSLVGGTSTVFVTESLDPVWADTIWGPYPDALTPGRWMVEGGQVSSGSVLSWTAQELLGTGRERLPELLAEAAAVPAAGHGLVALDNFMGNRTPLRDARLRGAFVGLSLGTTRADIYRATVEAVAYGTRSVLESFLDLGLADGAILVSGGIRHNPLWLSVTCDALGRPLHVVESDNLTLRASAAFAAVAAGVHDNLAAASSAFKPTTRLVEPDPDAAQAHDQGYERYRQVNAALTPAFHSLTEDEGKR